MKLEERKLKLMKEEKELERRLYEAIRQREILNNFILDLKMQKSNIHSKILLLDELIEEERREKRMERAE